jgi:hypothetical protein
MNFKRHLARTGGWLSVCWRTEGDEAFRVQGLGRVDGSFFELFEAIAVDEDRGLEGMDFLSDSRNFCFRSSSSFLIDEAGLLDNYTLPKFHLWVVWGEQPSVLRHFGHLRATMEHHSDSYANLKRTK